jgi:nucleoside-diphosphate-sugar epimerase
MSDVVEPMIHEDRLPGHESELEPKPDWEPRYRGSDRLKGKVALITGADSGIGRAVAALYAREGADVAILYLCEHDDAAKTKQIVAQEGRRAITIAGDVGDKQFCERAVKQTVDELGRLDILVNNAGEQHPDEDIRDITEDQLKRTFQTNIFGMFFLVQAALPHLKEGSSIINCTSVTMYKGSPQLLDEGRNHRVHAVPVEESHWKGHSRERRCSRAYLDSAQPVRRPEAGGYPGIRQGHADGPPGAAE